MGTRRRNLFVLLFVVVLVAASLCVDRGKQTMLGLDLRGGTELVYQGAADPAETRRSTPEDVDRAIEIIRERIDSLGVSEPEISRVGEDQIEVGLPTSQNAERAIDQVGTTAQLYFYDFEPNVDPARRRRSQTRPSSPQPASTTRSSSPPSSEARVQSSSRAARRTGPLLPLRQAAPAAARRARRRRRRTCSSNYPDEAAARGREVIAVPQGTVVVEEQPDDDPTTEDVDESATPLAYFVLRDRPALARRRDQGPRAEVRPEHQPAERHLRLHRRGPQAFQEVTRTIAQRGLDELRRHGSVPGDRQRRRSVLGPLRDRPRRRDRLAPDHRLRREPRRHRRPHRRPDLRQLPLQEAQDLAEFLKIGALPVELKLISQTTVSATLGQEALDQGLKAGIVGLILVLLFLIAYYRFLGVVAALGLLVYAVFFFALMKLIPITLTLPGIAGLILTIGVAADSNIVIFERIKEEVRAGKSMLSAICDRIPQGDRDDHRRKRDHADHRVHPLRARDRGRQGLRLHARHRHDRLAVHGGRVHPGRPRASSAARSILRSPRFLGAAARSGCAGTSTSPARASGSSRSPA